MKQTAVEWLAEKLEYVNWMRNRDEKFPELADKWRKHYLEQALEMEKMQIIVQDNLLLIVLLYMWANPGLCFAYFRSLHKPTATTVKYSIIFN